MKKLTAIFIATLLSIAMMGCTGTEANKKNESANETSATPIESTEQKMTLTVGIPKAPPSLPVLRMIETNALGDNVEIKMDFWSEPETLIAMVQDKNHDMFAFPLTVISTLYNKGLDVRLMNVNTWGVTYFMTSDPSFKSWSDLKGKTIYVPLQSSPPDALTQFFLNEAGLKIGQDVEIIYASMTEVATMLADGRALYATLIEPQVTKAMMGNPDLRVAFSFEQEWQRVTNTQTKIPNAGWGTTQTFIDAHPDLVSKFQEEYEKACIWANENPAEMAALAEKHFGLKEKLIEKSLPNMGLEYQSATDAKESLAMFYELLNGFNPKMIGGKIADEKLYYQK